MKIPCDLILLDICVLHVLNQFIADVGCKFHMWITLFISVAPYTMLEIRAMNTVKVADFSPRTVLKRYLQLAPLPLAVAFSWGFALSTAANLRHKVSDFILTFKLAVFTVFFVCLEIVPPLFIWLM